MSAMLAAILLAAAPAQAGSPEAAVAAIYAPYSGSMTATPAWDFPIYTKQVTDLIARWRAVAPQDEPDELSDGDWLCLCQDFESKAFKAEIVSKRQVRGGMEIAVRIDLGTGVKRDARLLLKREDGAWKLDDLYAASDFPNGLRQKLQEVIIEEAVG